MLTSCSNISLVPFETASFVILQNADNMIFRKSKIYSPFTGKERDSETGYSYFGARYYDSGIPNIFLSVDPMADKYPSISPYAYCAWNPVKLVDPDGEDISECYDKWQYNTSTGRLMWLSDEGGTSNQTVEIVHNQKGKTVVDQTVSFDGNITRMFDCSVINSSLDGAINGGMDVATGISEVGAGVAIGAGVSAISGGATTPLSTAVGGVLVASGGAHVVMGLRDAMSSMEGHTNISARHNYMKDACKAGVGLGLSLLKSGRKGFFTGLRSFFMSTGWSYMTWHAAAYPNYKGIPNGATVK